MPSNVSADEIAEVRISLDRYEKDNQRFLQRVVHDIRTARRALGISVELLLADIPVQTERMQQTAQRLQWSLASMDAILSGISSYSLSLAPSNYSFEPLSADLIVRMALTSLATEVREAGATVAYGGLPTILGDRDRLVSLFQHLISNAVKFRAGTAPHINIDAKKIPEQWLFSVQDDGIGIDRKHWEDIFQAFSRLHASDIPGVGLGLAICKKIVDAHHGAIWIESAPGRGTTVFFTLPEGDPGIGSKA